LHWAITRQTAPQIVASRADSTKPNMGLQTWKNVPAVGGNFKGSEKQEVSVIREFRITGKEGNLFCKHYIIPAMSILTEN